MKKLVPLLLLLVAGVFFGWLWIRGRVQAPREQAHLGPDVISSSPDLSSPARRPNVGSTAGPGRGLTRELSPEEQLKKMQAFKQKQVAARQARLKRLGLVPPPAPAKVPIKNGSYAFVPGMDALAVNAFHDSPDLTVLERSAGFVFFRANADGERPDGALPVAFNLASQTLGAVTGTIIVKMVNADAASAIASDYQLTPVQIFEGLRLGFFQSGKTNPDELMLLLTTMRRDPRIVEAQLEILDHVRTPQ